MDWIAVDQYKSLIQSIKKQTFPYEQRTRMNKTDTMSAKII